jgi:hypothetical protein
MKYLIGLCILILTGAPKLPAQQVNNIQRSSLPVYSIIDSTLIEIIDRFLAENSLFIDSSNVRFELVVMLFEEDIYSIDLNLTKPYKSTDSSGSIVMYKHPYCKQAIVQAHNFYFETLLCSRPIFDTTMALPTELFRSTEGGMNVKFLNAPVNYYVDNQIRGDFNYEDLIAGWLCEYEHQTWAITKIVFNPNPR